MLAATGVHAEVSPASGTSRSIRSAGAFHPAGTACLRVPDARLYRQSRELDRPAARPPPYIRFSTGFLPMRPTICDDIDPRTPSIEAIRARACARDVSLPWPPPITLE